MYELGFISRSISRMSNVDTVNFAFVINSQEIAEKEHDEVQKSLQKISDDGKDYFICIIL